MLCGSPPARRRAARSVCCGQRDARSPTAAAAPRFAEIKKCRGRARCCRDGRGRRRAALRRARSDRASSAFGGERTSGGLDTDADFTCPNCGFTTFASRSFQLALCLSGVDGPAARPTCDGARGAGRSVALAQIVTQARARDGAPRRRARARRRPPRRLRRAVAAPRAASSHPEPGSARSLGRRTATTRDRQVHGRAAGRRGLREVVGAALDDKKRGDEADGAGRRRRRFEGARPGAVLIAVDEYSAPSSPRRPLARRRHLKRDLVHIRALRARRKCRRRARAALARGPRRAAPTAVARRRRPRAARPTPGIARALVPVGGL